MSEDAVNSLQILDEPIDTEALMKRAISECTSMADVPRRVEALRSDAYALRIEALRKHLGLAPNTPDRGILIELAKQSYSGFLSAYEQPAKGRKVAWTDFHYFYLWLCVQNEMQRCELLKQALERVACQPFWTDFMDIDLSDKADDFEKLISVIKPRYIEASKSPHVAALAVLPKEERDVRFVEFVANLELLLGVKNV